MKKVAVIGAGICGLAGIKSCLEEGLQVACFEKTGRVGGLWCYHDDDEYGRPSVMKSTVINSHKEMTAFTDFPVPAEFPNYMHHSEFLKYIEMYADHFRLHPHIRFHREVVSVSRHADYDHTGRWVVTSKSTSDDVTEEEVFDGVMICTGHHAYRHVPHFEGLENFRGKVVHSHSLKTVEWFQDMRVLVVGTGNSGTDVAVEMTDVAKQVYLSARKGAWVVPRRGPLGLPFDVVFNNRLFNWLLCTFGYKSMSRVFEVLVVEHLLQHELYGLKPQHPFLRQHPTTNDYAPTKILSGRIIVRRNVKRFVESGVVFENEDSITPLDAVVLATGYVIKFPFVKEPFADIRNNEVNFYKLVFPPTLKHSTLAFIGLCQPNGAACPIVDLQTRWFAQLMKQKVKLPPPEVMVRKTHEAVKARKERYVESPRHTVEVDFIPYVDSLAVEIGAKPNLLKLFFTDPLLFWMMFVGPCLPYQYRLQGPHPWKGAREAIVTFPARVVKPLSGGLTVPHYSHFEILKFTLPPLILLISIVFNVFVILRYFLIG